METKDITGSNHVKRIAYDSETRIFYVDYMNGSYQYFDVGPQIWEDAKADAHISLFLNAKVKGIYRYAKV